MKKFLSFILVFAAIITFTGCKKHNSYSDVGVDESSSASSISSESLPVAENTTPISVVRDTFNEEIEALKAAKFDNIAFENLKTFSFPDVDKITTYNTTKWDDGGGLSSKQFFENYVAYCDYLAPGKYSEAEIAEKGHIFGSFDKKGMNNYNYNKFKELDKNGDLTIGYMEIMTPDLCLSYFGCGAPCVFFDGSMKKIDDPDSTNPSVYYGMISADRPIVLYTEDLNRTDVYHLADGDMSIADAVKKANKLLEDIVRLRDDSECMRTVCAVIVVDVGNGNYGYVFATTPVVDGIKYAFDDMRNGSSSYSLMDGDTSCDTAEMTSSDKFISFTIRGGWKETAPMETYDEIVPLKTAAESAAKLLSGEMKFKVKSVTLVYDRKDGSTELLPCWRFILENSNPEKYYNVYVNAITGEARVKAVQEVNSGQQFD